MYNVQLIDPSRVNLPINNFASFLKPGLTFELVARVKAAKLETQLKLILAALQVYLKHSVSI